MKKMMMKPFYGAWALITIAAMAAAGCSAGGDSSANSPGSGSKGGSMARFTIAGDHLYTVSDSHLTVLSVSDPARPTAIDEFNLGTGIETIFAMDELLFVGSQAAMFIYDISAPSFPKKISSTSHIKSCDPVVAADTLAFVTLNSSLGSWCGQTRSNMLLAFDISDLENPVEIDQVNLSSPRGLAVDLEQKLVFVCDNGLKAYDITDPRNIVGKYHAAELPQVGRIEAYDCIALQGRLLVTGADGIYQLGYNRDGFTFISKIDLRSEQ